jgi:hypothetical protein
MDRTDALMSRWAGRLVILAAALFLVGWGQF